jgi:hypothetical protein
MWGTFLTCRDARSTLQTCSTVDQVTYATLLRPEWTEYDASLAA